METGSHKPNPDPEMELESNQASENYAFFTVHRQMVIFLFLAALLLVSSLACLLMLPNASMLLAVALAGAGGGFVSALRRLYSFQRVFPSKLLSNWPRQPSISIYIAVYSLIPPLVGAIAAVVLYLIFAAGLVQGDLFPMFELAPTADAQAENDLFQKAIHYWAPNSSAGIAKAFVWGFIAGFSERFVPDLLGRLSSRRKQPNHLTQLADSLFRDPLSQLVILASVTRKRRVERRAPIRF